MSEERITTEKGNEVSVFRTTSDVYGNPRYIIHYLDLATNYEDALKKSRIIGGKKYRGKKFGGGIVFQSYNIQKSLETLGL